MRNQHGSYSICLATLAWLATQGLLSAGEVTVAIEPPAELFQIVGPTDACSEDECPACECENCQPFAYWIDVDSISPFSGVLVDWTNVTGNASSIESAWHFDGASHALQHACAGCPAQSCLFGVVDDGAFGCNSTAFNDSAWDAMTVQRRTPRPTDGANLEPGEPAEVLLEIRSQLGLGPLRGTLYQPVDAVGECKAQNTFVAEIRASEQNGAEEATRSCPGESLAEECSLQVADSVSQAEPTPSDPTLDAMQQASAELAQLLRATSRELEQSANFYEDSEAYVRADRLREIAAQLRIEARAVKRAQSR